EAARVHFGRMHSAQVFHNPAGRIEANKLRIWICAGVELAVLRDVKLPEVLFGCRRFADNFKTLLRLLWIEAQDQRAVPRDEIKLLVRPGNESAGARAFGCVELPRLSGIGVHLDEKQQSADLIEIEVECFAAATVRPNDAAHQPTFAHWNSERLEVAAASFR